jgi:hypothetical protein
MSLAVADPQARALLKEMAIAWTDLADQAENPKILPATAARAAPAHAARFRQADAG